MKSGCHLSCWRNCALGFLLAAKVRKTRRPCAGFSSNRVSKSSTPTNKRRITMRACSGNCASKAHPSRRTTCGLPPWCFSIRSLSAHATPTSMHSLNSRVYRRPFDDSASANLPWALFLSTTLTRSRTPHTPSPTPPPAAAGSPAATAEEGATIAVPKSWRCWSREAASSASDCSRKSTPPDAHPVPPPSASPRALPVPAPSPLPVPAARSDRPNPIRYCRSHVPRLQSPRAESSQHPPPRTSPSSSATA